MGDIIVGVDIGTTKVCTVIGKVNPENRQVDILGKGVSQCNGVKKGIIVDIEGTSRAIRSSAELAEVMSGYKVVSAYVNILGMHVSIYDAKASTDILNESREIAAGDVDNVVNSVKEIVISEDKQVIDVIPRQYIVDGYDEIVDPVGMSGLKLELDAHVAAGKITSVQNIIKSMERAGIKVDGIVVEAMSTGELLLTPDEKEMGGVLIDIGGGVTDVSFTKNKRLIFYDTIPVGGDHITNDIAMGMKISYSEAEKIKKEYDIALSSLVKNDHAFTVEDITSGKKKTVKVSEVVDIIEARVYEIFALAKDMLQQSGVDCDHIHSVILSGKGITGVDGCIQLAEEVFRVPVRIFSHKASGIIDADTVTAVGIVSYASKMYRKSKNSVQVRIIRQKAISSKKSLLRRIADFIEGIF